VSWTNIQDTTDSQVYTNINRSTIYRTAIKNGLCGSQFSQVVSIEINDRPVQPIVSNTGSICEKQTVQFFATSNDGSKYEWNGPNGFTSNQQNPIIQNLVAAESGVYKVVAKKLSCVSDTSEIGLVINPKSVGGALVGDTFICSFSNNGTVVLSGEQGDVKQWEYSENQGIDWVVLSDTVSFKSYENLNRNRDYRVLVMNGECPSEYSSQTSIIVTNDESCAGVKIANLLTPNGDGKNDTWLFEYKKDKPTISVRIFSRMGTEVYFNPNYENEWDGTFNGKKLQDGTYYYIVELDGNGELLKGSVNLMR
jgi:gliding motility-associated-like protein